MTRIVTALLASVALLTLASPGFAQSPKPMKAAPAPHATPAGNHTCPKGSTYVKGYKKADGTKVKGYCRKS